MEIKNKMMNRKQIGFFAYVLCVAVIFCGCETSIKRSDMDEMHNGSAIQKVIIDSCEYIYANSNITSLTHKGNCKYCLERSTK